MSRFCSWLVCGLACLAACAPAPGEARLRLLAASSLTDVVGRLVAQGQLGGGPEPSVGFGASATLARQIADGAPADVFVAASREWLDVLAERELLEGQPVVLAGNTLVCVSARDVASDWADLAALAAAPPAALAVGSPGVPLGESTREALARAGVLQSLAPRLVGQRDARAVLAAVRGGSLPVGFVYASDARAWAHELRVVFAVDPALHGPIEYVGAVLRGSRDPVGARELLARLGATLGPALLAQAGPESARGAGADAGAGSTSASPGAELQAVLLSAQVAGWSVLVTLLPGILIGWLLARWESPLRAVLQGAVMLPLVVPPVVTGYLLLLLLGRNGPLGQLWEAATGGRIAYTTGACVIAAAVVGFPLMVESIRLAVLGVDPRLELVSRSLGRGRLATFRRVTLPLSLPGLLGGSLLCFARSLGEFGATIVLAGDLEGQTRTVPIAVYTLLNTPGHEGAVLRLVLISVGVSLAALWLSAWFARRQRRGARGHA